MVEWDHLPVEDDSFFYSDSENRGRLVSEKEITRIDELRFEYMLHKENIEKEKLPNNFKRNF